MIPDTRAGIHAQPWFHGEVLLLPVADDNDWPQAGVLDLDGTQLLRKSEFHLTLLGRSLAPMLRERLGDARIHALATSFDWQLRRTGAGSVLAKRKAMDGVPLPCASLIERIDLPALHAFRQALAAVAGLPIPDTLAHVTLYVAGDPDGIGLPDHASFAATRQFDLPLPGNFDQAPPALTTALRDAYRATDYRITRPDIRLRIGQSCPALEVELARRGAKRASLITACNPFSAQLPAAANALRQQFLQAELAAIGIATLATMSHDPAGDWPDEPGLLAIDISPDTDDALLRRYQQHALVALDCGQPARLVLHPRHRA